MNIVEFSEFRLQEIAYLVNKSQLPKYSYINWNEYDTAIFVPYSVTSQGPNNWIDNETNRQLNWTNRFLYQELKGHIGSSQDKEIIEIFLRIYSFNEKIKEIIIKLAEELSEELKELKGQLLEINCTKDLERLKENIRKENQEYTLSRGMFHIFKIQNKITQIEERLEKIEENMDIILKSLKIRSKPTRIIIEKEITSVNG